MELVTCMRLRRPEHNIIERLKILRHSNNCLITKLGELFVRRRLFGVSLLAQLKCCNLRRALSIARDIQQRIGTNLAFMESLGLELPLLLETIDNILVAPANLMRQPLREGWLLASEKKCKLIYLNCTILPTRFQPQHSQRIRNNHSLLPIIWRRDTFKKFQSF